MLKADLEEPSLCDTEPSFDIHQLTYRDRLLILLGHDQGEEACPVRFALWQAEMPFNSRRTDRWSQAPKDKIKKPRDARRQAEKALNKSNEYARKANDPETLQHHRSMVARHEATIARHCAHIEEVTHASRTEWKRAAAVSRRADRAARLLKLSLNRFPDATNSVPAQKRLARWAWGLAEVNRYRKHRNRQRLRDRATSALKLTLPALSTAILPIEADDSFVTVKFPPGIAPGAEQLAGKVHGRNDVYSARLSDALRRTDDLVSGILDVDEAIEADLALLGGGAGVYAYSSSPDEMEDQAASDRLTVRDTVNNSDLRFEPPKNTARETYNDLEFRLASESRALSRTRVLASLNPMSEYGPNTPLAASLAKKFARHKFRTNVAHGSPNGRWPETELGDISCEAPLPSHPHCCHCRGNPAKLFGRQLLALGLSIVVFDQVTQYLYCQPIYCLNTLRLKGSHIRVNVLHLTHAES